MKLKDLFEAPLADVSYHSANDSGSFDDRDRKLIQKYIKDNTYKEKLKGIPFNLYTYFVDDSHLKKYGLRFPEGELHDDQIEKKLYRFGDEFVDDKLPLDMGIIMSVLQKVLADREKDPDGVFFVMGDNHGGEKNQIGLTPWILIHRLNHAIGKTATKFDKAISALQSHFVWRSFALERPYLKMLPFKSAKIKEIDHNELLAEIGTNLLITGGLKLNMTNAPEGEEHQNRIKMIQHDIDNAIVAMKTLGDELKGKIFYI